MNIDDLNDKLNALLFNAQNRIDIYTIMTEMLDNGIALPDAIKKFTLGKKTFGMGKDASTFVMEKVYRKLSTGDGGVMFSKAIQDNIPEDEFMILFSAEENGRLVYGLKDAVYLLETKQRVSSSIKSELMMPVILLLVVGIMMWVLQFKVMPIIAKVLKPELWPDIAINLNNMSHFVVYNGVFVVGALILLYWAFSQSAPVLRNQTVRPILDKLPLYSEYKQMQGSSFLMSVSAMLSGGTSLAKTLQTLYDYATPYMRDYIEKSINIQARGGDTGGNGECLNNGLFNNQVSFGIYIYGDLQDFQKALYVISKKSSEDLLKNISSKLAVVRNLAMFSLLSIIISILSMISQLTAAMQNAS